MPRHANVLIPRTFACITLFATLGTLGCSSNTAGSGRSWIRTELYIGLTKPGGAAVSEAEWKGFVDTEVTTRFPNGFTELEAHGRYRGRDQSLFDEPARVLIILHPRPAGDDDAKIDAICREFVRQFDQESVLRTDSPASVRFVADRPRMRSTPAGSP